MSIWTVRFFHGAGTMPTDAVFRDEGRANEAYLKARKAAAAGERALVIDDHGTCFDIDAQHFVVMLTTPAASLATQQAVHEATQAAQVAMQNRPPGVTQQ